MVVGNTQLGERAQHPFRRFTAQLSGFNLEVTWQYGTDSRHGNLQALTAVWRTADDIQQTFAAYIHFRHAQFICVRVLAALNHFTNNHAVEATGNGFNAVHFQACHRDLARQRFAINGRIHPFA